MTIDLSPPISNQTGINVGMIKNAFECVINVLEK